MDKKEVIQGVKNGTITLVTLLDRDGLEAEANQVEGKGNRKGWLYRDNWGGCCISTTDMIYQLELASEITSAE